MSLVNELIKGLLPEEEKKQTTAIYAGGFKPPTSGHFEVVKQALEKNPEIDEFIILIGNKERNSITQDESLLIWEIYNNYLPFKVKIQPTSVPPIKAVYNFAKDHPTREVLWVIGAREGNEEDFKDITSRTKSISKYPNLELRTIVTAGGVSGTAAREASQVSFDKFKKFIPDVLSDEEQYEVYELVSDKVLENDPQDGKAAPYGSGYDEIDEGRKKKKDPKKGRGKKPKGSSRRLYTDEDPKDTVGVKFSSRQDIVDTFNKKSFKAKSHARQSQVINLVHQRVRAAYNRAKDPAVKKRLKTALNYAEKRKEASKAKTQRLKKQKLKENQMSQADFNLVGDVLRDKNKSKQIHDLLIQMFPKQKELLDYNYENDSYAEFKRVIFHIDKYKLEGPVSINYTDLKLDPQIMKDRERKYQEYIDGKIDRYFRDNDADPRTLDLSKLPPITVDSTGEVMDGNHRAFLAIKQQKPLKGYKIVDATNTHPNVEKILQIVGKEKLKENFIPGKVIIYPDFQGVDIDTNIKGRRKVLNVDDAIGNEPNKDYNYFTTEKKKYVEDMVKNASGDGWKSFNPIIAIPHPLLNGKYLVIDGNHRLGAFVIGKLPKIKALVLSEDQILLAVPGSKWDGNNLPETIPLRDSKGKVNFKDYFSTEPLKVPTTEGDTIEKYSAKGKATGKLKQGTVRKRLNIPKGKKIPLSLINKELARLRKMDKDPDKKGAQLGDKNQKYYKALQLAKTLKTTTNVNEAIDSSEFDFRPYITSLTQHMTDNGLKLDPLPQIQLIHDDVENGEDIFGKTAYYAPQTNIVVLFTYGRHPKDILRSYAHELVHVHQNMENRLHNVNTTDVNDDDYLEQLEREAYETGNIMFRSWTDSLTGNKLEEATRKLITEKKKKDPFGLNAYALELARGLEEEMSDYKVYLDMDGVIADFDKRFEDLSGMKPKEFESKYGKNKFWEFIDEDNKISFWVGIPEMPGAKALVDAVKKYNYELLTAPSVKKQSYLGKILWVRNHSDLLGGKPRINFKKAKEKHLVKPELSKTDILIDDREDTIGRWESAGGTGIHYQNISQVLNDLGKLGL